MSKFVKQIPESLTPPKLTEAALSPVEKALEDLLRRITMEGWPSGNPYSQPEIKAALKALAKKKGVKDWMDAHRREGDQR